jgi:hypothetical protein
MQTARSRPAVTPTVAPSDGSSSNKKQAEETPKPRSMADEIEELLQYRLTVNPDFSHRSVHIRSAEDGTIIVEVDGATFDGVGSVSDESVRSFLQDTIREWEADK